MLINRHISVIILSCIICTINIKAQQLSEKMTNLFYSAVDSATQSILKLNVKSARYWADIAHNATCDSDTYYIDILLSANRDISGRDLKEVGEDIKRATEHFGVRNDSIGKEGRALCLYTRAKYESISQGDSVTYYFELGKQMAKENGFYGINLLCQFYEINYLINQGYYAKAASYAREILEWEKYHSNKEMRFLARIKLYHIYTLMNVAKVVENYEQEIEQDPLYSESLTFETLYLFRKSQYLFRRHRYEEALQITERLLQTTELYGSQYEKWRAHILHSHVLAYLNRNEEAKMYLDYCKSNIKITYNKYSAKIYTEIFISFINARIAINEKRYYDAKKILDDSKLTPQSIKNLVLSSTLCDLYNQIYVGIGDYPKALEWLRNSNTVRDTLSQLHFTQRAEDLEAVYSNDTTIIKQNATIINKEQNVLKERTQAIFGGLLSLFLIMTILIARTIIRRRNTYARTQRAIEQRNQLRIEVAKQTQELRLQKELISEHNNDMMLSQSYAQRIQRGILPKVEMLNVKEIKDSLILYKPVENISGDYYWIDNHGSKIIICCADCSGHGISGALMSMVGLTLTSEVIRLYRDTSAQNILSKLDEKLIKIIPDIKGRDGINISIAIIDTINHEIQISAAWQNVIVVNDNQLSYIRGVRRRIGDGSEQMLNRNFENHIFKYTQGCRLYLYTDGLTNLIGSEDNVKLKVSGLKQMIQQTDEAPIGKRMQALRQKITDWRSNTPPGDDILLIGIEL